jgi:cob(I)alamin adenosyltransferase
MTDDTMNFYSPKGLCELIRLSEIHANEFEGFITIDTDEPDVENCNKKLEEKIDTIQETLFQAIFMLSTPNNWESSKEIKYDKTILFSNKKLKNRKLAESSKVCTYRKIEGLKSR